MIEQALVKALLDAGALIALFILAGLYRMAGRLGGRFIETQQSQAAALGAQAQAMEGLTNSVRDLVGKDNLEHREMLVLLRFIAQQQNTFEEVRVEHNKRKEQAHPHCPLKAS